MTMLRTESTDDWVYIFIPEGWPLNSEHPGISFYKTFDDAKRVQKFYGGPRMGQVQATQLKTAELVERSEKEA